MSNPTTTPANTPTDVEAELCKMFKRPEPPGPRIVSTVDPLRDNDKNTALHYAAAHGRDEAITKELLRKHTVDAENFLGWTPLMMACRNGRLSTVQLLLKLSADASRKNKFGYSVFLISIASGNLEIVSLILNHLLQGGISKRIIQSVFSPLSMAIVFQQQNVLELLVSQFDVDKTTQLTGLTPLMFATAMENTEAYEILVKHKADKTIKNHLNYTADEIKRAREELEKPEKEEKLTPAEMISMSPHMTAIPSPYYVMNHHVPYYMMPPPEIHLRKSSNTMTPSPNVYVNSPNVTPITPMNFPPQYFFPPDFSPGHYCSYISASPLATNMCSNDFLNARMSQSMFLSPVMGYPPPAHS